MDGVLNTIYTKQYLRNGKCVFVEDKYVAILKKMVDISNAKIVLSSSWRKGWVDIDNGNLNTNDAHDFIALKNKLLEFDIELFDKTPFIEHKKRGLEIQKWLDEHKDFNIESFVILDDMDIVYPLNRYLLQTSYSTGLRDKYIQIVAKKLNCDL